MPQGSVEVSACPPILDALTKAGVATRCSEVKQVRGGTGIALAGHVLGPAFGAIPDDHPWSVRPVCVGRAFAIGGLSADLERFPLEAERTRSASQRFTR
jgi:hypothetical protein